MNTEIFITCAVTGSGDTTSKSDLVPVTPKEIAESAIEAAKAGAAIAHCHVRDPETERPQETLISTVKWWIESDHRTRMW